MLIALLAILLLLQFLSLYLEGNKVNSQVLNRFLSFFVFLTLLVLFLFKNEYFGADTKNYLNEFTDYCLNPESYNGLDYTYKIIFNLLNFLMAERCEVNWIIWLWPYFVISIIFITTLVFKLDKLIIITLFSSFIGIELLTNAMRQGFSIAILFLSFSFYFKRRYVSFGVLAALSLLFHQASALIIVIFIISRLNYKLIVPSMVMGIFLLFGTAYLDFVPGVLSFKASIYKYMPYASDDFIVRLISLINLMLTFFVYLSFARKFLVKDVLTLNVIINIVAICSIVSIVPYLGFRVVYGVYPLFLLMTYISVKRYSQQSYKFLSYVTCGNIFITILWLCGSAHMRAIPFVSII
ncbi:EpsG family protein [Enterobacter hormaechei]|uniref:EpsG family protein n=1 Tax=Enterobacter hormaechei TaxID=158836 RepID=UPI001C63F5D3|nr:EpsG family protein [Enterobacter hormaechei]MBW7730009.1 EpsG family protein [Enterobacter hormaechei]